MPPATGRHDARTAAWIRAADHGADDALGRGVQRNFGHHRRAPQGQGIVPASADHPARGHARSGDHGAHAGMAMALDRHPRRRSLRRGYLLRRGQPLCRCAGIAWAVALRARAAAGQGRSRRHRCAARMPARLMAVDGATRQRGADGREPRHRLCARRDVRHPARAYVVHHAAGGDALEQAGQCGAPGIDRRRDGACRRGCRRCARPLHRRARHAAQPRRGEDRAGELRQDG